MQAEVVDEKIILIAENAEENLLLGKAFTTPFELLGIGVGGGVEANLTVTLMERRGADDGNRTLCNDTRRTPSRGR